ncbi:serine/threonine-protein kinase ATM-like [Miscanthus floridulus]|uniref:serine/threonine-protein kinase ATM-like n=1 Tax=Miscanthus floridulus TaxID=154761 RepID=UPI003457F8DE
MVHVKNVGGGPGDEDLRHLPRLPVDPKSKVTKKTATKKRKYLDAEIARVAVVAEATEHAKRGGARSGVWIVDQLSPEARATLEREFSLLNEQNIVIILEAIFSLCAGFSSSAINSSDVLQLFGDCKIYSKMSLEDNNWVLKDELPYYVEALSEITLDTRTKQPMLLELMEFIKGFVVSNEQFEKVDLNNLVLVCSLLCNLIHCAFLSRFMEEKSSLLQEAVDYITNILKHIVSFVMNKNDGLSHGLVNLSSTLDTTGSALSSIKSLLSSPIFNLSRVDNRVCSVVIKSITELLDELLVAISQLFFQISSLVSNFDAESAGKVLPTSSVNSEDLNPILDCKSSVADMDLDVMDSGEVDSVTASASGSMGSFLRPLEWKLDLVCIISTFFSVSSLRTWEILYSLVEKESDVKVRQVILLNLCRNISASSKTVSSVVHLIIDMRNRGTSSLLGPAECLTHIHALLKTLIAIRDGGQNADGKPPGREVFFIENQDIIFDLVNKATEISSVDWFSRVKLIDCVSSFVCLFPDVAQDLIGCLLDMLHDADYRVRLYLARQIVVLFQTWEGHNELFNDVCSSIGAKMVKFSDISPVTAREVLAAGPQSVPVIETALITLAHLVVHSEDVEVECVFMISAAAAIEPSQRELAFALFDSISRRLGYASRSKYLDQVMGPILFRWVACEMNLVSLVEVQEMFGYGSAEPKNFVEHCSSWLRLLPPADYLV